MQTRSKSNMSTATTTRTTTTATTSAATSNPNATTAATTATFTAPTSSQTFASQIPILHPPTEPNVEQIMRGQNYPRIRMPTVTNTNIEAWFRSMEHWFRASGIFDEYQRCETVLASIDPNILDQLNDQLDRAPAVGKFSFIKRTLIAHFADSEQRKLNRLLSEMPLGDKRPSELYHEMKQVAGNVLGDTALKSLWTQRLPESARPVIAATTGTSTEFTRIADTIVDALAPRTVQQMAAAPLDELSALKAAINELRTQISSFPRRSRSRSRGNLSNQRTQTPANGAAATSNSPANADPELCWYHQKYGPEARKCRSPCRNRARARSASVSGSSNPTA